MCAGLRGFLQQRGVTQTPGGGRPQPCSREGQVGMTPTPPKTKAQLGCCPLKLCCCCVAVVSLCGGVLQASVQRRGQNAARSQQPQWRRSFSGQSQIAGELELPITGQRVRTTSGFCCMMGVRLNAAFPLCSTRWRPKRASDRLLQPDGEPPHLHPPPPQTGETGESGGQASMTTRLTSGRGLSRCDPPPHKRLSGLSG